MEAATIEQTFVNIEKADEEYNKKDLEELSDEERVESYRQELKFEREVTEKSEALPKSG